MGDKSLDADGWVQSPQEGDDELHILFRGEEGEGVGGVLVGEGCAFDDLELVEFEDVGVEGVHVVRHGEHIVARLARKSEDEVDAGGYGTLLGGVDGLDGRLVGVSAVDEAEGGIVGAFDPVFDFDEISLVLERLEVVQQFVADTVGSCADDQSDDIWHGKRFLVDLSQAREVERDTAGMVVGGSEVGAGKRLEIGKVALRGVFVAEEIFTLLQLKGDGLAAVAIGRRERFVGAEGASADGECAIAVGA